MAALHATDARKLTRGWNWVYAVAATFAFYFNFFVLVVLGCGVPEGQKGPAAGHRPVCRRFGGARCTA